MRNIWFGFKNDVNYETNKQETFQIWYDTFNFILWGCINVVKRHLQFDIFLYIIETLLK